MFSLMYCEHYNNYRMIITITDPLLLLNPYEYFF